MKNKLMLKLLKDEIRQRPQTKVGEVWSFK